MNKKILNTLKPALNLALGLFFERSYLNGRHFKIGFNGYRWALHSLWTRNILHLAPKLPWPAAYSCRVANPDKIQFHPDDLNNFQSPGIYFQNYHGNIKIGRGCYIAQNVGIITQNHNPHDLNQHLSALDVEIGDYCWIGMNAVIMPGVMLGPHTVVGAGAVVTRSFPEGHIVIGGVPARKLRDLTESGGFNRLLEYLPPSAQDGGLKR